MSTAIKHYPFVVNSSSKKRSKNNSKVKSNMNDTENKENISININIPKSKIEEDDNLSSKQLKTKENNVMNENKQKNKDINKNDKIKNENISNISEQEKNLSKYQKAYDKYTEKIKEKTMRMEVDKIYKETERMKQKYEEKNSNLHKFDNNPQFQKMLNGVGKQLFYLLLETILLNIFSSLIYFVVTQGKDGISLVSFSLSVILFAFSILLLTSLKLGLLNDPYLSKAFRLFVVFEFFLIITTFGFNIASMFTGLKYTKKKDVFKLKVVIYILFSLTFLFFFPIIKYSSTLFFESIHILFGTKTEYSILMLNEQSSYNVNNLDPNLSTSMNDGLNKTTSDLLIETNNNKSSKEVNNDEEKYKNDYYFQNFHYSVSSERKKDYHLNKFKNNY